jgi:catechol 2,3-dioxygenase-like lactoylglutathione lyase family enzyme
MEALDLQYIDHFTLSVRPHELPLLREFYTRTFGLKEGPRPNFDFPGHWLYRWDRPIVHLAANLPEDAVPPDGAMATGKFNHVSFRCKDVPGVRKRLTELGLKFREAPVPGFPLHQIFLHDPAGLMIELTFDMPE